MKSEGTCNNNECGAREKDGEIADLREAGENVRTNSDRRRGASQSAAAPL